MLYLCTVNNNNNRKYNKIHIKSFQKYSTKILFNNFGFSLCASDVRRSCSEIFSSGKSHEKFSISFVFEGFYFDVVMWNRRGELENVTLWSHFLMRFHACVDTQHPGNEASFLEWLGSRSRKLVSYRVSTAAITFSLKLTAKVSNNLLDASPCKISLACDHETPKIGNRVTLEFPTPYHRSKNVVG